MIRYQMHHYHGVTGDSKVLLVEMFRLVDPIDHVSYEIVIRKGRLLASGEERLRKTNTLTFTDPGSANEHFLCVVTQHVNR